MEKYRIISRYEYYSPNSGITWTDWFQVSFCPITDTEEELKEPLNKCKQTAKLSDKASKRKTEFKVEKFEYIEPIITVKTKKKVKKKS